MPVTPCGTFTPTAGNPFAIVDPRGSVSMKPGSFEAMHIPTNRFQSVQHWMLEVHNEWLHSPPISEERRALPGKKKRPTKKAA